MMMRANGSPRRRGSGPRLSYRRAHHTICPAGADIMLVRTEPALSTYETGTDNNSLRAHSVNDNRRGLL